MAMGRLQTSGLWDAQSLRWLQGNPHFMNWENHKQPCLRSDIFFVQLSHISKHRKSDDCFGELKLQEREIKEVLGFC